MKKLLFLTFLLCSLNIHANSEIKIQCDYELDTGISFSVELYPYNNNPSGSYIKSFYITVDDKRYHFSGSDFQLATMKWDDLEKVHIGALIETEKMKLSYIHVGPLGIFGQGSLLDLQRKLGSVERGRYQPNGICQLVNFNEIL